MVIKKIRNRIKKYKRKKNSMNVCEKKERKNV